MRGGMHRDLRTGRFRQRGIPAGVIEMIVRIDNIFQFEPVSFQNPQLIIRSHSRIDYSSFTGRFICDDVRKVSVTTSIYLF